MKQLLTVCLALMAIGSVSAQQRDYQKEYEAFKRRSLQQYDDFRARANASYAKFMREAWPEHAAQAADPVPDRPEPPQPFVKAPNVEPSSDAMPFDKVVAPVAPALPPQPLVIPDVGPSSDADPFDKVVAPVAPALPPQPIAPQPAPAEPIEKSFAFTFYGTPCSVSLDEEHRFALRGVDENAVADAWTLLSSDDYLPIISECLALRDKLHLCDWGYFRLLERMTKDFFGAEGRNEACLMQMYILTQSGYKVRIARTEGQLVLLLPSKEAIYEYPYLPIAGGKYYITDPTLRNKSYAVFDREFPKERYFSLQIPHEPLLSVLPADSRTLAAERFPEIAASVTVNRNLIDFYDDYPLNDTWSIYAQASLSAEVKEQLYPALRKALEGVNPPTAADWLLNFVQTAFEYKIDDEQFGQERPLFADETLFYPYCDCEDRAILYSVLVRDLLGLDVVLLHYPEHLATAVHFDEDLSGDYIRLEDRKYLVCDPTYIGASIGMAMPQFKRASAEVVRID